MSLALYQPDIPQNTGTLMRLSACMGVPIHIVEPAGFPVTDKALRRAGLDYLDHVEIVRHVGWTAFREATRAAGRRVVLVETDGAAIVWDFAYRADDLLLLGRESAGVPDEVSAACDASVRIPMRPGLRSMNVAVAGAMALGEMLRQTRGSAG